MKLQRVIIFTGCYRTAIGAGRVLTYTRKAEFMTKCDCTLKYTATVLLFFLIASLPISSLKASESEDSLLYVKKTTWPETMLATRANFSHRQSQFGAIIT